MSIRRGSEPTHDHGTATGSGIASALHPSTQTCVNTRVAMRAGVVRTLMPPNRAGGLNEAFARATSKNTHFPTFTHINVHARAAADDDDDDGGGGRGAGVEAHACKFQFVTMLLQLLELLWKFQLIRVVVLLVPQNTFSTEM